MKQHMENLKQTWGESMTVLRLLQITYSWSRNSNIHPGESPRPLEK